MTPKLRIGLIAAASFLPFAIPAWSLGGPLKLQGASLWVLRIGLTLLGLVAAGVIAWFLWRKESGAQRKVGRTDDIDTTAAAARAKLAAARTTGGSTIGSLPVVLLTGFPGSAKTTVVTRSGMDAELLAGAVAAGDVPASTNGINVWYSNGAVYVEAGGSVSADRDRFARVIEHLRPRRMAAVFGRGRQAPRAVVVCVACDDFLQQGATDVVMRNAHTLRERLAEAAVQLGVRLPVYVLFTRADRIPYYTDYVRNLSNGEARQPLGAALPGDEGAAGLYADRETALLEASFQKLFLSLAEHRVQLLERESAAAPKPGLYEFPRELRKMAPLAVRFLVELCKPSQLQVSPILRGFYFTGVRPVIVTDAVQESAPGAGVGAESRGSASSATAVFNAAAALEAARGAASSAPAAAVSRKIPQWVFLQRFFGDVVLGDRAAMSATGGGTRVSLPRRILLAAAAVFFVLLAAGFTRSYFGNRQLIRGTAAAMEGVAGAPAGTQSAAPQSGPALADLERLDTLRAHLEALSTHDSDGAPLRLRFGLYTGGEIYAKARAAYFDAFERLLFGSTREAMVAHLAALPDSPRPVDDYKSSYDLLRAYLISTEQPTHSTPEFLAPVLLAQWSSAHPADTLVSRVAERQFAYFANELKVDDPYTLAADAASVSHARAFLAQFAGVEPIYQAMLAEVEKGNPPIQFNRDVAGSAAYVAEPYTVPGAYTKGGYAAMQSVLASADRFFEGEEWVLGDRRAAPLDKAKTLAELRERYRNDYVAAWAAYLKSATVVPYRGVKDAAERLAVLAGPQSPLLVLLATASRHSVVDTQYIGPALAPVQAVTPPTDSGKYIGPANQDYMGALAALQAALGGVAASPPGGADAQVAQAMTSVTAAKLASQKITQQFAATADGTVRAAVTRLLDDPVSRVEPYLRNYGATELNAKGASFCSNYRSVLAKYPFNPAASTEATPEEVAALFKPVTGGIWSFYDETVQNVLVRQGSEFVSKGGGSMTVSPAFRAFFSKAAAVSEALFPQGATTPQLTFAVRPVLVDGVTEVDVTVDGATNQYGNVSRPHSFTWHATPASTASIGGRANAGSPRVVVQDISGTWAPFRLFDNATRSTMTGNVLRAEWAAAGGEKVRVGLEVDFGNSAPVLRKGYFAGFTCVGRIAQ